MDIDSVIFTVRSASQQIRNRWAASVSPLLSLVHRFGRGPLNFKRLSDGPSVGVQAELGIADQARSGHRAKVLGWGFVV